MKASTMAVALSLASSALAADGASQFKIDTQGITPPTFEILETGFLITQELPGLHIAAGGTFKIPGKGWQYSGVSASPSMFTDGVTLMAFIDARDLLQWTKKSSLMPDPTLLPNGAPIPSIGALPGVAVRLDALGGFSFYFGKKSNQWIIGAFKDIKMPWDNADGMYKLNIKNKKNKQVVVILAAVGNRKVADELKKGGAYVGLNIGPAAEVEEMAKAAELH